MGRYKAGDKYCTLCMQKKKLAIVSYNNLNELLNKSWKYLMALGHKVWLLDWVLQQQLGPKIIDTSLVLMKTYIFICARVQRKKKLAYFLQRENSFCLACDPQRKTSVSHAGQFEKDRIPASRC